MTSNLIFYSFIVNLVFLQKSLSFKKLQKKKTLHVNNLRQKHITNIAHPTGTSKAYFDEIYPRTNYIMFSVLYEQFNGNFVCSQTHLKHREPAPLMCYGL